MCGLVDDFWEWLSVFVGRNFELGVFLGHEGEGKSRICTLYVCEERLCTIDKKTGRKVMLSQLLTRR